MNINDYNLDTKYSICTFCKNQKMCLSGFEYYNSDFRMFCKDCLKKKFEEKQQISNDKLQELKNISEKIKVLKKQEYNIWHNYRTEMSKYNVIGYHSRYINLIGNEETNFYYDCCTFCEKNDICIRRFKVDSKKDSEKDLNDAFICKNCFMNFLSDKEKLEEKIKHIHNEYEKNVKVVKDKIKLYEKHMKNKIKEYNVDKNIKF